MWTLATTQLQAIKKEVFAYRCIAVIRRLYPAIEPMWDTSTWAQMTSRSLALLTLAIEQGRSGEAEAFSWVHSALVFGADFEEKIPGLALQRSASALSVEQRCAVLNMAAYQSLAALGALSQATTERLKNEKSNALFAPCMFPIFWAGSSAAEQADAREALSWILSARAPSWGDQAWQALIDKALLNQTVI